MSKIFVSIAGNGQSYDSREDVVLSVTDNLQECLLSTLLSMCPSEERFVLQTWSDNKMTGETIIEKPAYEKMLIELAQSQPDFFKELSNGIN